MVSHLDFATCWGVCLNSLSPKCCKPMFKVTSNNLRADEVCKYNAIAGAVGVVPVVIPSKCAERVCPRRKSGTPVNTGRVVSGSVLMSSSIFAFCLSSKASQ